MCVLPASVNGERGALSALKEQEGLFYSYRGLLGRGRVPSVGMVKSV